MTSRFMRITLLVAALAGACFAGPVMAGTTKVKETAAQFDTLDSYLAWLEERGKADRLWYRRLADGRYERMTGRGQRGKQGEIFTREQLLRKYGFAR